MKTRLMIVVVAVACCWMQPQRASAQLEFLKGLFGGKTAPAQRPAFQPFRGHQALAQAVAEAEGGDLAKSLTLAADAFKDGGVSDPLEHPENLSISPNVLRLSKAWSAKGAKPADVVAVLIEVVLPSKTPGVVRPYVGTWRLNYDEMYLSRANGRVAAPESVAAELIRWAVLAKQTEVVKERLQAALKVEPPSEAKKPNTDTKKSDKREGEAPAEPRTEKEGAGKVGSAGASPSRVTIEVAVARVFAVQLAVAERDAESANKTLKLLLDDAKSANGPLLEDLCHAVSAAVREPKSEEAGLRLLEAVLDRAEEVLPAQRNSELQAGLRGNAPWLRVHAANGHARAGRAADAKRLVMAAIAKPFPERYGAEYTAYLKHSLKQNGAAALIDAGLIADGLELAGETPDPRAVRYFRSEGAVNLAAKVGQRLRKLAPAERFALLRKWALPSDDRDAVRSLIDFVPVHEPSTNNRARVVSGTALAAGDSPNDVDPGSPVASAMPLKASAARLGSGVLSDVYSTDRELVATAREVGKLDELVRDLSSIVPQTPSVQSLRTLAMVVRDGSANGKNGDAATAKSATALGASTTTTRLKALLDATTAAVPGWEVQIKPMPPMDTYVIAVEAAIHPEWRATAEAILFRLIEHSQRTQSQRLRDHFRMAWLETLRLRSFDVLPNKEVNGRAAGPGEVAAHWLKTMPKLWDSIGFESATERAMGGFPPTWFAHDGYLSHVSDSRESDLVFGLPLAGSFELTLECREGNWSEGRAGYGGASCQIFAFQDTAYLHGKGNSGYEGNPKLTNLLHKEPWNRYTIRVHDGKVKYYANGQPAFEDMPGTAAPWLTLGAAQGFTPSYRNLRISGSPTIPREVALLGDERLRGWLSTYFDESKPEALNARKFISVKIEQNGQTYNTIVEDDGTMEGEPAQVGVSETDWTFANDELRSTRRSSFFGGESPSLLTYQRPLRDGEMVSFEFWHQPGVTTAQPTFGEVVYSLGESDKHDAPASGRGAMVSVVKTNHSLARRASAGDLTTGWNSVAMSLNSGLFEIELNGKEVVSEKIEPTNSRRIGFFHDAARTDLRIRNVVLSGDWPKEFDAATRAAIESPEPNEKLANSRFLTYALGEDRISDNAFEISRQAVKLDTAERYKFLYRWVIPNESHDLLRTTGALTPTHPAPPTIDANPIDVATLAARNEVDQRFVQTGGNFVSPAILLVLAAAELNRLDELRQTVEAFNPASSGEMARNRAAMLGIIALLADDPGEAILRIRECHTLLVQHRPTTMYSRWGDAALASLSVHHPLTREAAIELLEFIIKHQVQAGNPGVQEFVRFVRQLHGLAMYLGHGGTSEEFGTQPKSKQWRAVPQPRARSRGEGYAVASYDTIAGEMALRGGHDYDAAYFQSPLRGDYEVSCRLSHFDWREIQLMGAGIANALKHTHNEVKVSHPRSAVRDLPLEKPITPRVQQWHDYKLVVKDGRFTSFVNGQKLYEAELTAEHDPWLAIVGWAGQSSRAVRDLVITGKPTIPKEINLLGSNDLIGWMTDYYASEWGQQVFEWTLEADGVMQAPQQIDANPGRDRRKVENIIRYHRPMLEDGEISYEFYYDPEVKVAAPPNQNLSYLGANAPKRTLKGKTLVHPALDRMVCLLEPDGVKIHWLTDGRWERTGLTADNVGQAARLSNAEAGELPALPLKPREWNAIKFKTKADTLTIELNGETVFTHDIEPTNLRHFGLFHYANESNVKVRNIRYRGDWPTKLPSVADQELASGPLKKAEIPDADLPDSMTWDFTKSKFDRAEFQSVWDSKADKFITATDAGLRYSMPAGEKKPQVAGIAPRVHISGDFIATMDYDGLRTVAAVEHWGSGIAFNAGLDNSYQIGIEVRHVVKSIAKVTSASAALVSASRPNYFHNESISDFPPAGRLRLQRKGAVIYYLIAAPGSEKFRLIAHRPCGTQDIKYLAINADASDTASGSEFVLKSLSIRAAKILKVK